MCDPVSIIGTTLSVAGQVQQGRAARRQANAAAAEDEYQAAVERSNAQAEADVIRRAGRKQRGETLAGIAASGVKIGEGSALDAEREVMESVERDAYLTILTGERRGSAYEREAEMKRRAGRDAARSANISAFGSLLSAGAGYARASGWRLNGPGFSGTQAPAPVVDLSRWG
jgi:hypothetical protein